MKRIEIMSSWNTLYHIQSNCGDSETYCDSMTMGKSVKLERYITTVRRQSISVMVIVHDNS